MEIRSEIPKTMKVTLPENVSNKLSEVVKELRRRGSEIKQEDLLTSLYQSLDENYWSRELDKHTPDEYFIELGKQNPEIRKLLIVQAKRALERISKGEGTERSKHGKRQMMKAHEEVSQ